jgi:hypothetical protein
MNIVDVMTDYLRGEKLEALVFILPLGLASLVFGAWLLTDAKEPFFRGVAAPFLVLGLVLTIVGGSVGFRTPAQVERLSAAFVAEPEKTRAEEQARMEKVNKAWPVYLTAWATFTVVGLLLRFALKNEFARGIGIALVFFGGVGMLIDGFAERRAHPYTRALESPPSGSSAEKP